MPIIRSAQKAWRGEEKLWIVFWGWIVSLDIFLIFWVAPHGHKLATTWTISQIAVVGLLLVISIWQLCVVARCARSHKSNIVRTGSKIFALLIVLEMLGSATLSS